MSINIRMTEHRKPSLPFPNAEPGTCKWCGRDVGLTRSGRPSKATWHKKCYRAWKLHAWPSITRKAVWRRDKGICANCGEECAKNRNEARNSGLSEWHMDHVKPLVEAKGDISYWKLSNLQSLCDTCHKLKTSAEATSRALLRKMFPKD